MDRTFPGQLPQRLQVDRGYRQLFYERTGSAWGQFSFSNLSELREVC